MKNKFLVLSIVTFLSLLVVSPVSAFSFSDLINVFLPQDNEKVVLNLDDGEVLNSEKYVSNGVKKSERVKIETQTKKIDNNKKSVKFLEKEQNSENNNVVSSLISSYNEEDENDDNGLSISSVRTYELNNSNKKNNGGLRSLSSEIAIDSYFFVDNPYNLLSSEGFSFLNYIYKKVHNEIKNSISRESYLYYTESEYVNAVNVVCPVGGSPYYKSDDYKNNFFCEINNVIFGGWVIIESTNYVNSLDIISGSLKSFYGDFSAGYNVFVTNELNGDSTVWNYLGNSNHKRGYSIDGLSNDVLTFTSSEAFKYALIARDSTGPDANNPFIRRVILN